MFVRVPGQREGEVSDENAMNTDLLPTIIDALDIETEWEFDGRSLLGDDPAPPEKPVFYGQGPSSVSTSLDGLFQVVARNADRFPEPGWEGVVAAGALGQYVGDPVSSLDVSPVTDDIDAAAAWRLDHPERFDDLTGEGGRIPLIISGSLALEPGHEPAEEALVVVNGVVAGVAGDFQREGGQWRFSALLDYEQFAEGDNEVELLLLESGAPTFITIPRA